MEYTNDLLEGRFEFHQQGVFYSRSPRYPVYLWIIIAAALSLSLLMPTVLIYLTGVGYDNENFGNYSGYYSLTIGVGLVVIWLIAIAVIRILNRGYQCRYTATLTSLKLDMKSRKIEYRYSDVINVMYSPITDFGKRIGFNVTVVTKQSTDRIIYLSPTYKGEACTQDKTPFFLLNHPPEPPKRMSLDGNYIVQ